MVFYSVCAAEEGRSGLGPVREEELTQLTQLSVNCLWTRGSPLPPLDCFCWG